MYYPDRGECTHRAHVVYATEQRVTLCSLCGPFVSKLRNYLKLTTKNYTTTRKANAALLYVYIFNTLGLLYNVRHARKKAGFQGSTSKGKGMGVNIGEGRGREGKKRMGRKGRLSRRSSSKGRGWEREGEGRHGTGLRYQ